VTEQKETKGGDGRARKEGDVWREGRKEKEREGRKRMLPYLQFFLLFRALPTSISLD